MKEDIDALKNLKFDPSLHNVVIVAFNDSGSTYSYFYPRDLILRVGDRILVVSPYNGVTTVTVKECHHDPKGYSSTIKPIYGVIAPECSVWDVGIKRKAQQLMDLQNLQNELKTRQEAINEGVKKFEKLKSEILELQRKGRARTSSLIRDDIDASRYIMEESKLIVSAMRVTETEDPF